MSSENHQNNPKHRSERREAAVGEVVFHLDSATGRRFRARLLDVSPHGFRAAHAIPTLSVGTELDFEHPGGSGKAVVVWNRIDAAGVETGFFVKEARDSKPAG